MEKLTKKAKVGGKHRHQTDDKTNHRSPHEETNRTFQPKVSVIPAERSDQFANTNKKFEEACAKIQKHSQRVVQNRLIDDESSEEEEVNENVLVKFKSNYLDGGGDSLGRTEEYLQDAIRSGALTCLICICSVKKIDAVWNCTLCYTSFHFSCVQKWSKDSIVYQLQAGEGLPFFDKASVHWFCPKCRNGYKQTDVPKKYVCFCGKQENPPLDPWLLPHSCGQNCEKCLIPHCGHKCVLLCHPGPCPPCPKTVSVKCHCQKSGSKIRRCSDKNWSCLKVCEKLLNCGQHKCASLCHEGECPPCSKTSVQKCQCGRHDSLRPCNDPIWCCQEVCNKKLSCKQHYCEVICHPGCCDRCPRSGPRSCPCGKNTEALPCTEDIPTCGETCDKLLKCGVHKCTQRCHPGECGLCIERSTKTCRCGAKEKEVSCAKEFLCEVKCKRLRDCNKHSCNRKCCIGDCPTCEQVCNKTLGCKNHKCTSFCHLGPCYPCPLTSEVKCNCGATKIVVPCGRERTTKPPLCKELCKISPICEHEKSVPHNCHKGPCPSCKQICMKVMKCTHTCPSPCHTAVPVKTKNQIEGPWDTRNAFTVTISSLPCPPCMKPLSARCVGGHETTEFSCCEYRSYSCGRPCGRNLLCGVHKCDLICHPVANSDDTVKWDEYCGQCTKPCEKSRPPDCVHECRLSCHVGPCPRCKQQLRLRCHCGVNQKYVGCSEWTLADPEVQEKILTCKSPCNKKMKCGHPCSSVCHSGLCSPGSCKKKAFAYCPCRKKRVEVPCFQAKSTDVDCDKSCKKPQVSKKKPDVPQVQVKEANLTQATLSDDELIELNWQRKMFGLVVALLAMVTATVVGIVLVQN